MTWPHYGVVKSPLVPTGELWSLWRPQVASRRKGALEASRIADERAYPVTKAPSLSRDLRNSLCPLGHLSVVTPSLRQLPTAGPTPARSPAPRSGAGGRGRLRRRHRVSPPGRRGG